MKVYVVGYSSCDGNSLCSIHKTYKNAFKAWDKIRISLLTEAKDSLKSRNNEDEMYERIIKRLSCKDPKKIDNGPHETPYLREYELEE